ncbi:amidase [Albidovulum sediminicola]|uniref:Amidase n=1 Tax=Albidovulum sediminicola TaxID=2984331 RepID=A0ABT2Z6Z7_9RHOB|nr:amidase [Defluviimonas sp. WL0075]MCV2866904.1 amidase [Defluviimonas sp. WL0075]
MNPDKIMPNASRLAALPAHRLREMIAKREISIPELVRDSLGAIEQDDDAMNAFASICPERALVEAEAAQARLASGEALPPLFGLPLAVKDAEPVAGLPFVCGSRVFADRVAEKDSVHVSRLRSAGAIVVGKSNTPEFTLLGETRNGLGPDTLNPWDPGRTPGGSSGGSAAALAAGMVPIATGSDTAGSITVPAAFCGVVGIKPSHRRIPLWPGPEDWRPFSDVGPMARNARDLALMFAVAAGVDPRDPDARSFSKIDPIRRPLRIAWSPTIADLPVDPVLSTAAETLARLFADGGHVVRRAAPDLCDPGPLLDLLGAVEEYRARGHLMDEAAHLLMPETRAIIEQGRDADPSSVETAKFAWRRLSQVFTEFMADYDLLIVPATSCPAYPLRTPPSCIDGRDVTADWPSYAPFNMLGNLTGCPVATLPISLTKERLPVGALIFSRFGEDELLLSALAEAEALRGPFPLPFTPSR